MWEVLFVWITLLALVVVLLAGPAVALALRQDEVPAGEFWNERFDTHVWCWAWLGFISIWIRFYFGDGPQTGSLVFSGLTAFTLMVAYGFMCLVIVPLLPLVLLALLSICLEARWRIRNNQPYVKPPPAPYVVAPPPVVVEKRGSWLLPLVIGLWIGSSWGGDD